MDIIDKIFDLLKDDVVCPLTQVPIKNPVMLRGTRMVYEMKAISEWLKRRKTCPLTNKKLNQGEDELIEIPLLKSIINNIVNSIPKFEEMDLKFDIESRLNDLESKNRNINHIDDNCNNLQNYSVFENLSESIDIINAKNEEIKVKTKRLEELDAELRKSNYNLSKYKSQIKEMQKTINIDQEIYNKSKKKLDELEKQSIEMKNKINVKEKMLNDLSANNDKLKDYIISKDKLINELSYKLARILNININEDNSDKIDFSLNQNVNDLEFKKKIAEISIDRIANHNEESYFSVLNNISELDEIMNKQKNNNDNNDNYLNGMIKTNICIDYTTIHKFNLLKSKFETIEFVNRNFRKALHKMLEYFENYVRKQENENIAQIKFKLKDLKSIIMNER